MSFPLETMESQVRTCNKRRQTDDQLFKIYKRKELIQGKSNKISEKKRLKRKKEEEQVLD